MLLHLGDHDPSGIDMTRDSDERLAEIARMGVTVRRLALNMDQVTQYNPPPNPAKQTDSRFTGYEERFGSESWELDALPQRVIGTIITDALRQYIDQEKWDESMRREQELRKPLAKLHRRWEEISRLVDDEGLPLDRLQALELAGCVYPMAVATNLVEAAKVVRAHDADNNRHLLEDLVADGRIFTEAQRRLDEVAEMARQLAAERASDETDEQDEPSEEPDYGIDDED
ncbi:hypothetical protein D3C87_1514970 [compost metagenome]